MKTDKITLIIGWYDSGVGSSLCEYDGNNLKRLDHTWEDIDYDEDKDLHLRDILEEIVNNKIKTDEAKNLFHKYEHIIICENGYSTQIK